MISRLLDYNVKRQEKYVRLEPLKDPFDLIDTRDPLKESVDTLAALLDSIESNLLEVVSMLDELGSHGVSITLEIGRRHNRTAEMTCQCITALFAVVLCNMSNIKVSFNTNYEQAQCVAYLIGEIMLAMDRKPKWWENLEKLLESPTGNPYVCKESNEALAIISAAMGCLRGMNYMESGGLRYTAPDPEPPLNIADRTEEGE